MLDNVCELVRSAPYDSVELVDCLSNLTLSVIEQGTEKLMLGLLKKTRGFFYHEQKDDVKEWIRRPLYYNFVFKVLKSIEMDFQNVNKQLTANAVTFVTTMSKNVVKDRKQSRLEELAADVQLLCEKLTNHQTNQCSGNDSGIN